MTPAAERSAGRGLSEHESRAPHSSHDHAPGDPAHACSDGSLFGMAAGAAGLAGSGTLAFGGTFGFVLGGSFPPSIHSMQTQSSSRHSFGVLLMSGPQWSPHRWLQVPHRFLQQMDSLPCLQWCTATDP